MVAGEASGDQLGAAFIEAMKQRFPGAVFAGIGGTRMQSAGLDTWWDSDELAVFGLFEVLGHLPRLVKLRRKLQSRLLDLNPDVFIGIDAPDFNLGLEARLKSRGIRTVHYVSPTVWAWRPKRVRKIARAADLVLCLFPFEPDFYRNHSVAATYVGHPMADQIPLVNERMAARQALQIDAPAELIALLPGSRVSEVSRLADPMIRASIRLGKLHPRARFVAALASDRTRLVFQQHLDQNPDARIEQVVGNARTVMAAADAVMCASGTATLETMLVNRPLVSGYRISPATYHLVKTFGIIKPGLFALPNILAGECLVPELIQHDASAEKFAREINRWLLDSAARQQLSDRFEALHRELQCDASQRAADAVSQLLKSATR